MLFIANYRFLVNRNCLNPQRLLVVSVYSSGSGEPKQTRLDDMAAPSAQGTLRLLAFRRTIVFSVAYQGRLPYPIIGFDIHAQM